MKRVLWVFIVIFIILIAWLATVPFPQFPKKQASQDSPTPRASIAPKDVETSEKNIIVSEPQNLDRVSISFTVAGSARVFENVVSIRLKTLQGETIYETTAYANSPDVGKFGDFEKLINFKTDATEGVLEVFQASAKDGSEIDKVVIPLLFD